MRYFKSWDESAALAEGESECGLSTKPSGSSGSCRRPLVGDAAEDLFLSR